MALRWCAAGMSEAGIQYRRVNCHLLLLALQAALARHIATENVVPPRTMKPSTPPTDHWAATEFPETRDNPPVGCRRTGDSHTGTYAVVRLAISVTPDATRRVAAKESDTWLSLDPDGARFRAGWQSPPWFWAP